MKRNLTRILAILLAVSLMCGGLIGVSYADYEDGGENPPVTEGGGDDTTPPGEGDENPPPVTEGGEEEPPVTEGGEEEPPVTEGGEEEPPVTEGGEDDQLLDMETMALTLGGAVAAVVPTQAHGTAYETVLAAALVESGTPNVHTTLEAALNAAVSGQTVVLLEPDYTMIQSAVVKQGVTLLLPCNDTYQAYLSRNGILMSPDGTSTSPATGLSGAVFSNLTVPSGITLTVSGTMLVNAVTGRPQAGTLDQDINGGYSTVTLEGDIIVTNGGKLDAFGLITGSGQVTAQSGSKVGDLYVVRRWRGGSHAWCVVLSAGEERAYPMTEMDCHNIQTTLRVESGAVYEGLVKMYASSSYYYSRFPQISNTNGLIRLKQGAHVIKTYDASAKRSTIKIYGGATGSQSTLNIVGMDLSTELFVYPISGHISIELYGGNYNIAKRFKFMPGAQLYVGDGASLTVDANQTLVFYDKFEDNITGTTQYPQTYPAAQLTLGAGGKFFVSDGAYFGGQIASDSTTGVAQATFANGAVLEVTTYESGSQNGTGDLFPSSGSGVSAVPPYTTPFEFKTLLMGSEANYRATAGNTYFYSSGWAGGEIPIGEGTSSLKGKIILEGRTNHAGAKVEITVGSTTHTAYTGNDGSYVFNGIGMGVYKLTVSMPQYLGYSNSSIQVMNDEDATVPDKKLLGGDVNGDGKVDVSDLSTLKSNYQKSGDILGDINGDSKVDVSDLSTLKSNYQKSSVSE